MVSFKAIELNTRKENTTFKPTIDIKKARTWDEILAVAKRKYLEKKNEMMIRYSAKAYVVTTGTLEVYDLND